MKFYSVKITFTTGSTHEAVEAKTRKSAIAKARRQFNEWAMCRCASGYEIKSAVVVGESDGDYMRAVRIGLVNY